MPKRIGDVDWEKSLEQLYNNANYDERWEDQYTVYEYIKSLEAYIHQLEQDYDEISSRL